jgi:predicted S18 family serine protease
MNKARFIRGFAAVAALTLVTAACGGGSSKSSSNSKSSTSVAAQTTGVNGTGSVTINPLFVSTDASGHSTGGTEAVTVRIQPSPDGKLRVGFNEDEVNGTGPQWQAAGWDAVAVATLITGAPLTNRDVEFDITGKIDGPSAGTLMTIGVLSLLRGDKLDNDITMTGTINPDGTVGPVGGIPYKIQGVIAAHKKRMLIPTGQRNSPDDAGKLVDVVAAGQAKGIAVTEVSDIYAAYKAFTGKDLPQPTPSTNVALDEATYQKLKAKVETWSAKYASSISDFNSLAAPIRSDLRGILTDATSAHAEATKLSNEGLQAGAFSKAVQAAAFANAASTTGSQLQVLLTQGVAPFVSKIKASESISGDISGLVDTLKTFQPKTVSDAGALVEAYGDAVDAVSLSLFAQNLLSSTAGLSLDDQIAQVTEGAVFYEFAGTIVGEASDVLDVGRDLGGAQLGPKVDTHDVAEFFRKAGEANLSAFETVIINPEADQLNISDDSAKQQFEVNDLNYGLSVSGLNVMGALQQYFGTAASSDYAELGGAVSLYNRTSGLIAKYYSLGVVDPKTLDVTGISNDAAFSAAISLAQSQLAGGVGLLQSKNVNPTIAVADNEIAGVDREGDASDKIDALTEYWDGYLNSRVLSYLGGFASGT